MRRLGVLLGTVVVVAIGALAPTAALGYSSGTFTKAVATEDWTHGSFAATVNAAPCGSGYCSYFPIVFAQPSLPDYGCTSEEFAESDRNIRQVWTGPTRTTNGTLEAVATNVGILSGVYGQRYCLELIGEREVPDVVCEALGGVLEGFEGSYGGPGGSVACPPRKVVFGEYAAGAVMTVEVPPAPPAVVPPLPPAAAVVPTAPSEGCTKGEAAVVKAWQRVTKARKALKRAKHKHRPTKIKRQGWQRAKKQAQQTEEQQRALCG